MVERIKAVRQPLGMLVDNVTAGCVLNEIDRRSKSTGSEPVDLDQLDFQVWEMLRPFARSVGKYLRRYTPDLPKTVRYLLSQHAIKHALAAWLIHMDETHGKDDPTWLFDAAIQDVQDLEFRMLSVADPKGLLKAFIIWWARAYTIYDRMDAPLVDREAVVRAIYRGDLDEATREAGLIGTHLPGDLKRRYLYWLDGKTRSKRTGKRRAPFRNQGIRPGEPGRMTLYTACF